MSLRENAIAALAAKLVTANVASGRIYRTRQEAIVTLPSVIVQPVSETVSETVLGLLDRLVTVEVSVLAKGDTPDNAADSTVDAAAVAILADRSLGLGSEVQVLSDHETRWDYEDFDVTRVSTLYQISMRSTS